MLPDYKDKNIYADLNPNFSWYLKTNVKPVPGFKDNKVYSGGIDFNNFTQQDSNAYNQYLVENNAGILCIHSARIKFNFIQTNKTVWKLDNIYKNITITK